MYADSPSEQENIWDLNKTRDIHALLHPKAPGIEQVPSNTEGNKVSQTLCPINNGSFPGNFSKKDLDWLTGQNDSLNACLFFH